MYLQSANQKPALKHKDGLLAHGEKRSSRGYEYLWAPLKWFHNLANIC